MRQALLDLRRIRNVDVCPLEGGYHVTTLAEFGLQFDAELPATPEYCNAISLHFLIMEERALNGPCARRII